MRSKNLLDVERRQAHGGLVHAEEARPRHQGARHRHHLLLAARERAGGLAEPLLDPRESSNTRSMSDSISALSLRMKAAHLEVLAHAHAGKQAACLGHRRDAALDALRRRQIVDGLARVTDRAVLRFTMPRMVFMVVDLPDALPPNRQTISPVPTR